MPASDFEDRPPEKKPPSRGLHGLDPGELLARGLNTVKPSGGATAWDPPTPEELGRILPQYRIESLIGRGGMGAVYKGTQLILDRPVAIKLLPAEIAADEEFIARFHREARTLAKLQHSRVIIIHDFGQTSEGHLYFVMEYIDGTDLRQILRGPGLNPDQALLVVGPICDALHAAHSQGGPSSRHQAREHPHHQGRLGKARRLWPVSPFATGRSARAYRHECRHGHGGLYGAGAARWA